MLLEQQRNRFGYMPEKEAYLIPAWESSARAIARILDNAKLYDVYVAMEYCLSPDGRPTIWARRPDFLFFGKDKFERNNILTLESKQWELAEMQSDPHPDRIQLKTEGKFISSLHPSKQAEGYAIDLTEILLRNRMEDEFVLSAYAYLQRMKSMTPEKYAVLFDPKFEEIRKIAPLITASHKDLLVSCLKRQVGYGDGKAVWDKFRSLPEWKI